MTAPCEKNSPQYTTCVASYRDAYGPGAHLSYFAKNLSLLLKSRGEKINTTIFFKDPHVYNLHSLVGNNIRRTKKFGQWTFLKLFLENQFNQFISVPTASVQPINLDLKRILEILNLDVLWYFLKGPDFPLKISFSRSVQTFN